MRKFQKVATLWVGMMAITTAILWFKGVNPFEAMGWAVLASTLKTGWSHVVHGWWMDVLPDST